MAVTGEEASCDLVVSSRGVVTTSDGNVPDVDVPSAGLTASDVEMVPTGPPDEHQPDEHQPREDQAPGDQAQAADAETPPEDSGQRPRRLRRPSWPSSRDDWRGVLRTLRERWVAPVAFVGFGVVLFFCYLAQARTIPATSESGGQALQAWDMLHGNLLLHGWTFSDVSFYTTELPEYALVELIHGLNSDTVHVAAALSYTLIVLLGGLLAKGRSTGREGLIRFGIAAGIMLAPPLSNTALLLGDPDHTGTHVPLLLIFIVLDRAPRRWWSPVIVALLLTWAQVADTLVLYEGAIPIAIACAMRAYRRRGPWRDIWYDVELAVGAAVSAVLAKHILTVIREHGGFIVKTPMVQFVQAHQLPQGVFTDLSRVLDVYGAKFLGMSVGASAAPTLLRLIGVALAVWAVAAGLRRLYGDTDLIASVLTLGFVIVLAAYVLGTKNDTNEIVGLLPLGAVLAGRLLSPAIIRNGLVPVLAVVLIVYAVFLGSNALQPSHMGRGARTAAWLASHHLDYGLGNFWTASGTTVDSGGRVKVRPVRTFDNRIVTTLSESDATWYDPTKHYANYIIASRWWVCGGVCVGLRSVRESFGRPAFTYAYGNWRILVFDKNLLAHLRTVSWCNSGWPWNTPDKPAPGPCLS
jgi:hypothetical protein